jgi:predicted RNA-binding protein YlxR (DUF448 family)
MPEPIRTCVGCGAKAPQRQLVRLRLDEGRVVVDRVRAGGRGAWLHAERECLERAEKRRAFGRVFRRAGVAPSPELLRDVLTGSARKD